MIAVLSHLDDLDIECCHNSLDLTKRGDMTDEELGFKDCLNDGMTWAEGCLCRPEMNHICICHAVHDLCTHKEYSIPDLLRMNDFWCEVGITHQHIVAQDGARMGWWENYSYDEFAKKLRIEAEYIPPICVLVSLLRFGRQNYSLMPSDHLFGVGRMIVSMMTQRSMTIYWIYIINCMFEFYCVGYYLQSNFC